jgi:protein N-terminal methyltransferase
MSDLEVTGGADALISREASRKYWDGVDADVNGMLGGIPLAKGFSNISKIDLQGSRTFLAKLGVGSKSGRLKLSNTLEGGAGLVPQEDSAQTVENSNSFHRIGRVTEGLLLNVSEHVDVIEPVARFTAELHGKPGIRNIFNSGLAEWQPTDGIQYDLIWTQWCVGYLTDAHLVRYLENCKDALNPDGGFIVIKENLSTDDSDIFDEEDSSVTR